MRAEKIKYNVIGLTTTRHKILHADFDSGELETGDSRQVGSSGAPDNRHLAMDIDSKGF